MQAQSIPTTIQARPGSIPPGFRLALGWVAICTTASLIVSLAWWAALGAGDAGSDSSEMLIAPGTAEAIANGYPVSQPSEIQLRRGGTLTIVNQDVVAHTVGWVTVGPGETTQLQIPPGEGALQFDCTTHPSGRLAFDVSSRLPLWQAITGALAAGVVMGLVLAGVTAITGRLGTD